MSLKGRSCWVVKIRMDDAEKLSLEAIGRFVEASEEIRFAAENREQLYGWVERVLVGQGYAQQGSLKFQGVAGNSFRVDLNGGYVQRHESIRSAS